MLMWIKSILGHSSKFGISIALQIFKNCIPYLAKVGLDIERATNFSSEDSESVTIPNALGSIAFEFYKDFIQHLKSGNQIN